MGGTQAPDAGGRLLGGVGVDSQAVGGPRAERPADSATSKSLENIPALFPLCVRMTKHPFESQIEKLALGRLRTLDSIKIQCHLFNCGPCLRRLIEIEFSLVALDLIVPRGPALDKRKPLFIVHDTADGFVYCQTVKLARGKWLARNWGDQLNGARECRTMREANDHLLTAFREMFPEHGRIERC